MRLGALGHLADVGIATNLAFGILDIYRGWIRTRIADKVTETSASLERAIVAVAGETAAGSGRQEIAAIRTKLENSEELWQAITVWVAMAFAGVLAVFLVCASVNEDCVVTCNPWELAAGILFLGVSPILACWLAMSILFRIARKRLTKLGEKYKDVVDFYTQTIQGASLKPTDPGTPPPPPAAESPPTAAQ